MFVDFDREFNVSDAEKRQRFKRIASICNGYIDDRVQRNGKECCTCEHYEEKTYTDNPYWIDRNCTLGKGLKVCECWAKKRIPEDISKIRKGGN